jgi:hypothetical protein
MLFYFYTTTFSHLIRILFSFNLFDFDLLNQCSKISALEDKIDSLQEIIEKTINLLIKILKI